MTSSSSIWPTWTLGSIAFFGSSETEFYLKDQVLHLADLEGDLEAKRRTLRVIRQIAEEIIAFLAQIEDVQKRLFEKRKFVLRTDYLVPIMHVPRALWKEVLANKAQIAAWKALFAIEPRRDLFNRKGQVNEQFLAEHPTLVVDTAHFEQEFKDRLLAAFDDLDEATDGLLIRAENYQALRLLEPKYAGKMKCIYIDPPYNTGSDEFIYKDRYRHSSWMTMLGIRLDLARSLMSRDGLVFVSSDENEMPRTPGLMDQIFGDENRIETFTRRTCSRTGPPGAMCCRRWPRRWDGTWDREGARSIRPTCCWSGRAGGARVCIRLHQTPQGFAPQYHSCRRKTSSTSRRKASRSPRRAVAIL